MMGSRVLQPSILCGEMISLEFAGRFIRYDVILKTDWRKRLQSNIGCIFETSGNRAYDRDMKLNHSLNRSWSKGFEEVKLTS